MKIMNRKEFLSQPSGVIYSNYESHGIIGGLFEKWDSLSNDWYYHDLLDSIDCNNSEEQFNIIESAENNGTAFQMDLSIGHRDGMFEEDEMFVVYSKDDVNKLMERITELHKEYPID